LKAFANTRPGSFGRHVLHAVQLVEQDHVPLDLANVTSAVVSFMDGCLVPTSRFKELSNPVAWMLVSDASQSVQVLEARLKI
jgi:hypothetical protein